MRQSKCRKLPHIVAQSGSQKQTVFALKLGGYGFCVYICAGIYNATMKQSKPRPQPDTRFFNPDACEDWLTGKPKKKQYIPKGKRPAPQAINIIR